MMDGKHTEIPADITRVGLTSARPNHAVQIAS